MKRYFLSNFWTLFFLFACFTICSSFSFAQTYSSNNSVICKRLAIEGAQLANQSYAYSKESHFEQNSTRAGKAIDTAIFYIQECILSLDSVITLANDSDSLGLMYAKTAKNFAAKSYRIFIQIKESDDINLKRDLSQKASYSLANAVIDAYHSSFYFSSIKKKEPKQEELAKEDSLKEKELTKLDIDQALFNDLAKEVEEKKESIDLKISELKKQQKASKDLAEKAKLKDEIKKLELEKSRLEKQNKESSERLAAINTLVTKRDKLKKPTLSIESKKNSTEKNTLNAQNNNNIIHPESNAEMPLGLLYRVQLGVYKKTVSPEIFKGLVPVYSKKVEKGISYATGMFDNLNDAKEAQAFLASLGFKDAFIVAYNDRKKIAVSEAIKIEKK